MTVAIRRSGGPFFPVAVAPYITITTAPDGGWTQIPEDRAVYHNGYTYIAWVDGTSGDVEVAAWNDSSETLSTPIALHGSALDSPADTHDCPGLFVEGNSHKLIAIYSAHNGTMYRRVSVNSLDSDPTMSGGFTTESTIATGANTYPIIVQRMSETNDPVYVWYRSFSGSTGSLVYRKSTDGGDTWGSATTVYSVANKTTYWKIICDGLWRIDFFVSSSNPFEASSVGHFYADDEDYKLSDGTAIGGLFPFTFSEITTVEAGGIFAWWTDAMYDEDGEPAGVYNIDNGSGTDSEFKYARWNGSAWIDSTIVASVGAGVVDPSPVATLDAELPTECHLVRFVSGQFEIWRYVRSGDTWNAGTAVTSGSGDPQLYPTSVKNHPSGELGIVWLSGTYSGASTAFDLSILGVDR